MAICFRKQEIKNNHTIVMTPPVLFSSFVTAVLVAVIGLGRREWRKKGKTLAAEYSIG
jgi:hypothetical protein